MSDPIFQTASGHLVVARGAMHRVRGQWRVLCYRVEPPGGCYGELVVSALKAKNHLARDLKREAKRRTAEDRQ